MGGHIIACNTNVTERANDQSVDTRTKTDCCQHQAEKEKRQNSSKPYVRGETPLLTAAKLGIREIVEAILDRFPKAIEDEDCQKKNVVLLAAENRQNKVYSLLERKRMVHEYVFRQVDDDGNSALHLASRYNENRSWNTPGPALQLKWEFTWHKVIINTS